MDKEKLDEITTTTAVGAGFKKDILPNKGRNKREDRDDGTCYCPVCKEKKNKSNKEKSCCEQTCPDCDSVMTNVRDGNNE
jgi:hypothetical protein